MKTESIDLLDTLLIHRKMFLVLVLLGVLGAAAIFWTRVPIYKAEVTILPRGGASSTGLLGRLTGFSDILPQGDTNLEDLYGKIVISDAVLDSLSLREWSVGDPPEQGTLVRWLELDDENASREVQLLRTKRELRSEVIRFHRDFQTGFMVLTVSVPRYPRLARDLANGIADYLNRFNIEYRTKKSRDKRAFIEERLAHVDVALEQASARIADFRQKNRNFHSSPALQARHGELERELRAQETIWVELKRQYELVKIEENRETLTVDVLDRALLPLGPSGPGLIIFLIFGGIVGFIVALVVLGGRWLRQDIRQRMAGRERMVKDRA